MMLAKIPINNPGNIRISNEKFIGEVTPSSDAQFKQFSSMAYGYRAMFKILDTYRNSYQLDTITEIISRWAPPAENDTTSYINSVSSSININPNQVLPYDQDTTTRLVYAISYHENGITPNMAEIQDGLKLAGTIELVKVAGGISIGVIILVVAFLYINRKKTKHNG